MITTQDKELLAKKGITEEQIVEQLACFQTGFPFLKLDAAASIEKGILAPDAEEQKEIAAIITHVAFYAGWPKGWAVFNLAKEVWNEDEAEK